MYVITVNEMYATLLQWKEVCVMENLKCKTEMHYWGDLKLRGQFFRSEQQYIWNGFS